MSVQPMQHTKPGTPHAPSGQIESVLSAGLPTRFPVSTDVLHRHTGIGTDAVPCSIRVSLAGLLANPQMRNKINHVVKRSKNERIGAFCHRSCGPRWHRSQVGLLLVTAVVSLVSVEDRVSAADAGGTASGSGRAGQAATAGATVARRVPPRIMAPQVSSTGGGNAQAAVQPGVCIRPTGRRQRGKNGSVCPCPQKQGTIASIPGTTAESPNHSGRPWLCSRREWTPAPSATKLPHITASGRMPICEPR